jgi:hypothetical protein
MDFDASFGGDCIANWIIGLTEVTIERYGDSSKSLDQTLVGYLVAFDI